MLATAGVPRLPGNPRTAEQIRQACTVVPWSEVQPGDLLFADHHKDRMEAPGPDGQVATHVAISLGKDSYRVWSGQDPRVHEVVITGSWWQGDEDGGLIEARRPPSVPATPLTTHANRTFPFAMIYPVIRQYASLYDTNPVIMAGIGAQESGFKNYLVHDDGHGRGLFGLDDRYGLLDFQKWIGMTWMGDGGPVGSICPVLQIEYLAKWLTETTEELEGDVMRAARAWHTGKSNWHGAEGDLYEADIYEQLNALGLSYP